MTGRPIASADIEAALLTPQQRLDIWIEQTPHMNRSRFAARIMRTPSYVTQLLGNKLPPSDAVKASIERVTKGAVPADAWGRG